MRLFWIVLIFFISLYFSTQNWTFLALVVLFGVVLYRLTRNVPLTAYVLFLATLPFVKGKTFEILLVPKEAIERWALFDIRYFFPIVVSDLFLGSLLYLTFRRAHEDTGRHQPLSWWPYIYLALFIVWALFGGIVSTFPEVGWLSSVQLVRLFIILGLPLFWFVSESFVWATYSVAAASIWFESLWALGQRILGGPLGRAIESYTATTAYGIRTSESDGLLRVTGTFQEPSILGVFLLMQMALLAYVFPRAIGTSIRFRTICLSSFVIGSVALVFTGSRMLYGVWAILVVLVWRRLGIRFYPRQIALAGVVLVAVSPYLLARFSSVFDSLSAYGSLTYRMDMVNYAARLVVASPLVGVGISQLPYWFATGFVGETFAFDPTYPHSIVIQLLTETGGVGAALFFLFVAAIVSLFVSGVARAVSFFAAMIVYLIAASFYPLFLNHPEVLSFFFLYAGFAIRRLTPRGSETSA